MTDAVFLDTNIIRNADANSFFGNASKFQQISRLVQIYIPKIVIEEIKWQKWEKLRISLDSFKDNYFCSLIGCDAEHLSGHIPEKIAELYDNAQSEFAFTEISLRQELGHIDHLKDLAVQKLAPFETKSDKGFKDAYIYLTIKQFLAENASHIFLFTNDGKLKEAFHGHELVTVLTEPDQYFDNRSSYFKEGYFLETLNTDFNERIASGDIKGFDADATLAAENIEDVRINEDDEWELALKVEKSKFSVIVDFYSKEIIDVEKL
ncbi:MAG: PIN domain-containing protein [Pseudobdellovibrionaceae bacterium]